MMPPALFFLPKIVLPTWGLLCLYSISRIICSSSVTYASGTFIGFTMSLQIALDSIAILTAILLIPEHNVSFHLFALSSNSFLNVLQFSEHRSFTSLVRFIAKFFFFDATVLTYLSDNSFSSVQFSSVAQVCPTICDPMNCSMTGLPVHHQLLEFTQTHVHQVGDVIQTSYPLSSPSLPSPNPSQHQSVFQ